MAILLVTDGRGGHRDALAPMAKCTLNNQQGVVIWADSHG